MYDANGILVNAVTPVTVRTLYSGDGLLTEFTNDLQSNTIVTFGIHNPSGPITYLIVQAALVSDPDVKSPGYLLDCTANLIGTLGPEGDARINYGVGDLLAALFTGTDSAGQPTIIVYQITSTGEGEYIGTFD